MSRTVALPDEIYEKAERIAQERNLMIEDLIVSALADRVAAHEQWARRAANYSPDAFRRALEEVPDVEPEEYDRF